MSSWPGNKSSEGELGFIMGLYDEGGSTMDMLDPDPRFEGMPEKKLLFAVLKRAVEDLQAPKLKDRLDAIEWIMGIPQEDEIGLPEKEVWPAEYICNLLDLDYPTFRTRALATLSDEAQARSVKSMRLQVVRETQESQHRPGRKPKPLYN